MTKEKKKKTGIKRKAIDSLGQNQFDLFAKALNVVYTTFYIYHRESKHYTSIAAKNIHHASNKATKEIYPLWNGLTDKIIYPKKLKNWTFLSVAQFNEFLKSIV